MQAWGPGVAPPRISVNVAGLELLHPDVVTTVDQALADHGWPPTASSSRSPSGSTPTRRGHAGQRGGVRRHGVRFSIDDFSTTGSTFDRVAAFPVTTLKIDRSFVQILGPSDELNALVSAIVAMTERLGLDCVAEGVETSARAGSCSSGAAPSAQGYFFSPPLFPADVERMMRGGDPRADGVPEAVRNPATPATAIPLPPNAQR